MTIQSIDAVACMQSIRYVDRQPRPRPDVTGYLRKRFTLLRTVFWYGARPAPSTRVVARCSCVAVGARPTRSEPSHSECHDVAAVNAMPASDAADASTFSSTMRFVSRSCAAEGWAPALAMAAVRVAITRAEPCIISIERCARSNQALASEGGRRLMVVLRQWAVVFHESKRAQARFREYASTVSLRVGESQACGARDEEHVQWWRAASADEQSHTPRTVSSTASVLLHVHFTCLDR